MFIFAISLRIPRRHIGFSLRLFLRFFFLDGEKVPKKRKSINFDECRVVVDDNQSETVQITVNDDEIQRRIQAFVDHKREEINRNNLRDFIDDTVEDSCARVNDFPKAHSKIKRVRHETGTGLQNDCLETAGNFGIEERLQDVELLFGVSVPPISKDIYQRLKVIESEIRQLMTISPEYCSVFRKSLPARKKIVYSAEDLDKIISAAEEKKA